MWLVMLLPFLAVPNGLAIPVAGASLRVDQLAACVLVVPLGASVLLGARRLWFDKTMGWLAAILAMNLIATALHSPAPISSLLQCASLTSVWFIYVLLVNFLDTKEALNAFLRRLMWAAIVSSVIAVGASLLASAGADIVGAEVSDAAAGLLAMAGGADGVMVEPHIFGTSTSASLVLSLVLSAAHARDGSAKKELRLAAWPAGISAVALVLSFTRAACFGTPIAL